MLGGGPKRGRGIFAAAAVAMFGLSACGGSGVTESDTPVDAGIGAGEPVCEVVGESPSLTFDCPPGTTFVYVVLPYTVYHKIPKHVLTEDRASFNQIARLFGYDPEKLSGDDEVAITSLFNQMLAEVHDAIAANNSLYPENPNEWIDLYLTLNSSHGTTFALRVQLGRESNNCTLPDDSTLTIGGQKVDTFPLDILFSQQGDQQQQPMPPVCLLYTK